MKKHKTMPAKEILKETGEALLKAVRKGTVVEFKSAMGPKMKGVLFLKNLDGINAFNRKDQDNIVLIRTFGFRPLSVDVGSTDVQFDHKTFNDLVDQAVGEWFAEQRQKYPGGSEGPWYPMLDDILGQLDHVINFVEKDGVEVEFEVKDNEQVIQTVTTKTKYM